MTDPGARSPLDTTLWLALSSLRTTAILATLLALLAGVAAVVPQGHEALALAALEHSDQIRTFAAWGLTDVFGSAWLKAAGVLFAVNVVAVFIRTGAQAKSEVAPRIPAKAPHRAELRASLPERAVESLRETFRSALGTSPLAEKVEGSRVTMVFDTAAAAARAPLLAHLGLAMLVAGAAWAVQPAPKGRMMVRALLEVKDSRSQTVGRFDLAQGETVKFFQWRPDYVIREYVQSKDGLGPAIRMERIMNDQKRITDFWVYLNAPPGFDERHRRDIVAITAKSMGLAPMPGAGLTASPGAGLLLAGLGLLLIGILTGARPAGRIWLEADGDEVRIVGVPGSREDPAFQKSFERWTLLARSAVEGG